MGDNVYLIIGASSDVGIAFIKSLDRELQRKGQTATIVAHFASHDRELLMLKSEVKCLTLVLEQADLSEPQAINDMLARIMEYCECPDYIIHFPASKPVYTRMKELDWGSILKELEIQVHSLGETAKVFLPKMGKRKRGKIVIMLTAYTIGMPPKFMPQYVVAKYALLGLMKSMAIEFADKGININGISPNMMETKFLDAIDDKIIEMDRASCTMKRHVKVEEVVAAIHFLLSDGSDYMNGVNLNLTGGDR